MGPRFCKRGNAPTNIALARCDSASMGPRFCKRGNARAPRLRDAELQASMGPRFCKRGNQVASAEVGVVQICFNGATLL